MKFLLSVAAVIAVAVAVPTQRGLVVPGFAGAAPAPEQFEPIAIGPAIIDSFEPIAVGPAVIESPEIAEIQEIIAAIQSPSTDPATAAALEEMLLDILGVKPEPVAVGPAIIDTVEPIAVGPALIPEGVVAEEPAIVPSPVAIVEGPAAAVAASTPLVQIILNINQAAAESSPIAVAPVVVPETIQPTPVHVVEESDVETAPVDIPIAVNPIGVPAPEPIQVIETAPPVIPIAVNPIGVEPEPIQVIETAPLPVEPVVIGVPIIPEAAVVLPEELN